MDTVKDLHRGKFLSYSLTSQDAQFLGCQTISTKQQIVYPAKGNDMK